MRSVTALVVLEVSTTSAISSINRSVGVRGTKDADGERMRVFISSLLIGLEPLRQAAKDAVTVLGQEPVMAEDFGALSGL